MFFKRRENDFIRIYFDSSIPRKYQTEARIAGELIAKQTGQKEVRIVDFRVCDGVCRDYSAVTPLVNGSIPCHFVGGLRNAVEMYGDVWRAVCI